ncbi:hypothetical protein BpHYR1_028077 [Brachionus plicatilis]|uniref:Uncharacterized protein n=1 Tax=Brachionus plicatilis TaxID=10195 RepID=A0A3M7R302_BRAPC|nr:hypothetical protein BpHYR1_028077 [Brachionus plicatilis]
MPALLYGTIDLDRHFHSYGISVCRNEDFKFILKALAKGIEQLQETIQVHTLVSYTSDAIRSAVKEVFGEKVLLIILQNIFIKILYNCQANQ